MHGGVWRHAFVTMRGINRTRSETISEHLNTPLAGHCDVFVCGGGPAGIAAAVSAAREGARVTLVEAHGCLGGVWTSGCLSWLIDHENKTGLMAEIKERLMRIGGMATSSAYDCECMKLVLDEMAAEAGVRVLLHSHVVAARVDSHIGMRAGAQGRLTHAIVESRSGRQAWSANVFIDASGDGDLAARAGCRFEIGHPETGETQPMSLMALVTGVNAGAIGEYHDTRDPRKQEAAKHALRAHLEAHGHSPSYASPTLFHIRNDLFALMATHQYGRSALDAGDLTQATIGARAELHAIIAALRHSGGAWAGVQLVATAAQIGVREARRIRGLYTVSAADIAGGRRHDDAICDVTFCVDIHSTSPAKGKSYHNGNIQVRPYQIPLRAAIAADVDGLMLAGRCISGDFFAHASYRVTGNAVQMGESVGRAAALASSLNLLPHKIPVGLSIMSVPSPS
ncbi:Pyridine nucleotide-disulfide oxidoreductase [Opitutaceae bacterium TAV1]|nr:Pyridine nucleotide-disulfide oxidoreductase [Opitutaceae bacterium TAV1]